MTNSTLARAPAASLIALLALSQAALGILRALGWFQLYVSFAWGTLKRRPWTRTVGLMAATVNVLLVLSVLIQGESILRGLVWCIVPVLVVYYVLAQPRAAAA